MGVYVQVRVLLGVGVEVSVAAKVGSVVKVLVQVEVHVGVFVGVLVKVSVEKGPPVWVGVGVAVAGVPAIVMADPLNGRPEKDTVPAGLVYWKLALAKSGIKV